MDQEIKVLYTLLKKSSLVIMVINDKKIGLDKNLKDILIRALKQFIEEKNNVPSDRVDDDERANGNK